MSIRAITLILVFPISLNLFGQETKKRIRGNETFYVLKSDKDTKHGEYIKDGPSTNRVQGQYNMGDKVGVWEYYSFGQLSQKYDFTKGELTFQAESVPFVIKSLPIVAGEILESETDTPPILIGGMVTFSNIVFENLKYPNRSVQGRVYVDATITKDGKIIDEQVSKGISRGLDEEALRVVKLLPDEWIPATLEGQPVDCRISLAITFKLG